MSWDELGLGSDTWVEMIHFFPHLLAAMLLGAVVGLQREISGKAAGLRTHILVCVGTALSVLAGTGAGMSLEAQSRVIQGLVTGIGFLGAGSILKLRDQREIHGLTTAADIWMTAAIGVAVGLGMLGLAVLGTLFIWLTLALLGYLENKLARMRNRN